MTGPETSDPVVGNDVVDLRDSAIPPARAYVERVCAPSEMALLARTGDPCLFWVLFAAKEAAFKALVKAAEARVFAPRRLVVDTDLARVNAGAIVFDLSLTRTSDWVHAVAATIGSAWSSCIGRIPFGRSESQAAREMLYDLASTRLGYPQAKLEVVRVASTGSWDGRGPPRLHAGGRPLAVDVSLSHDGRFAACALSQPPHARGAPA